MTIKYSRGQDFIFHCKAFMKGRETPATKFEYALMKVEARISNAQRALTNEYNEDVQDIKRDTAQEDEHGNLIIENNSYKWTREGKKSFDQQVRARTKELNNKEIEVSPYLCTGKIPPLNEYQVLAFAGLVIPEYYCVAEPQESEQENHQSQAESLA